MGSYLGDSDDDTAVLWLMVQHPISIFIIRALFILHGLWGGLIGNISKGDLSGPHRTVSRYSEP